ncbi:MAG: hypothetical protein NTW12_02025 [Deltaproteobacteria bacterium]|nr:hypothetical protein [Deltaproteobacteria bacterium]
MKQGFRLIVCYLPPVRFFLKKKKADEEKINRLKTITELNKLSIPVHYRHGVILAAANDAFPVYLKKQISGMVAI